MHVQFGPGYHIEILSPQFAYRKTESTVLTIRVPSYIFPKLPNRVNELKAVKEKKVETQHLRNMLKKLCHTSPGQTDRQELNRWGGQLATDDPKSPPTGTTQFLPELLREMGGPNRELVLVPPPISLLLWPAKPVNANPSSSPAPELQTITTGSHFIMGFFCAASHNYSHLLQRADFGYNVRQYSALN
ncbi:unnamed protein product [Tuber aestivum]|uniref:Uncharacterized protein n=1 Tax=Tuber aestivum TaxID=59557 RepID=A0A292PNT9_9PEZI|nr:unnamed protein product [Tuber aestivum]